MGRPGDLWQNGSSTRSEPRRRRAGTAAASSPPRCSSSARTAATWERATPSPTCVWTTIRRRSRSFAGFTRCTTSCSARRRARNGSRSAWTASTTLTRSSSPSCATGANDHLGSGVRLADERDAVPADDLRQGVHAFEPGARDELTHELRRVDGEGEGQLVPVQLALDLPAKHLPAELRKRVGVLDDRLAARLQDALELGQVVEDVPVLYVDEDPVRESRVDRSGRYAAEAAAVAELILEPLVAGKPLPQELEHRLGGVHRDQLPALR